MSKNKYLSILMTILIVISLISCKQKDNLNSNKEAKNNPISQPTSTALGKQPEVKKEITKSNDSLKTIADLFDNLDTSKSQFEKGYYDYKGTIDGNIHIQMSLYQLGQDNIVGTYIYNNHKKEISLKGKAGDKNIILYEYDENGKSTGLFQGNMTTTDKIEGTWIGADGIKKFPFSLSLVDIITGAEYGKRYQGAVADESDEEVEKNVAEIQNYIITNNKEKLAEVINYPIKAKIKGKLVNIANKDELIKNYDDIFYPAYKKALINTYPKNMFANYRGIMFGENLLNLWIVSNSKFQIITINN